MKKLILLAAAAAGLASCGPPRPYWHRQCLASYTTVDLVPMPSMGAYDPTGLNMGGGMVLRPVPREVCTEYAPAVCVVPEGSETSECPR